MFKIIAVSALTYLASAFHGPSKNHPSCTLTVLYPDRTCDNTFDRFELMIGALVMDNAGGSYRIISKDSENLVISAMRNDNSKAHI